MKLMNVGMRRETARQDALIISTLLRQGQCSFAPESNKDGLGRVARHAYTQRAVPEAAMEIMPFSAFVNG
jgi:hypothetical protein